MLCTGVVAFVQLRQIPVVATAVLGATLGGSYLIWRPDHATALAHWIGIGRGADLVFYVWVLVSFAVALMLYLGLRKQQAAITSVARAIALFEADRRGKERRVRKIKKPRSLESSPNKR